LSCPHSRRTLVSEKERALGARLAADLRQQAPRLESERARKYVEGLGAALVAQLENPRFGYQFEVVVSERKEPAALPGGYVLVPARALLEAGSEAELRETPAHAVAHVALRHGIQTGGGGRAAIPLIFIGGWAGFHAGENDSVLVPAGYRETQRKNESEADEFGRQLAARVGEQSGEEFRAVQDEVRRLVVVERKKPSLYRQGQR
jgi:predicted Zn-dependent protease